MGLHRLCLPFGRFPQIDIVRTLEGCPLACDEHPHLWTVGIGRVGLEDDADFARVEPDEIAHRINTNQLREAPHEVLIELRAIIALQDGEDAIGREGLLVHPLRSHRVVHVGDPAERRPEIEMRPGHAGWISGPVCPEVMLEGDDRRERRHLRCPAKDLRALDRMTLQDAEFLIGEPLRLVEDLRRRAHLADVVHQRRQPELAQQRPVNPEAARLAHGQDRHVHHVRERVVVVILERRQRQERRAILRHRLRERIDNASPGVGVGHPLGLRAVPQRSRHRHRIVVQPPERRDIAHAGVDAFFDLKPAHPDVR